MQNFGPLGPPVRSGPDNWSANWPILTFFTEMAVIFSFLGILIQGQRHSTDNIKGNKKCWYQNLSMTSLRGSKSRSKLKKNWKSFNFFFVKIVNFWPKFTKKWFFNFFSQFYEQINPFSQKNRSVNAKTVISKIRFWTRGDFSRFRRYLGPWLEFLKCF